MSIKGLSGLESGGAYDMKLAKIAQDQAKVEGEATTALIEQAQPPPPESPGGPGSRINVYA